MAWEQKYECYVWDLAGVLYTVKFYKDGWAGSVVTIYGSENAIEFGVVNSTDGVFDQIKATQVMLTMVIEQNFVLRDIYSSESMSTYVEVFKDENSSAATPYWTGFVDPTQYEEPYDVAPQKINVTCVDGLVLLTGMPYNEDASLTGLRLESQIILDVLSEIGVTEFKEYINIYEEEMLATVDDSPLDQAEVDVAVFETKNCQDVLVMLLKKYNACITQKDGVFSLYRPTELIEATVYGRYFTAATTKTSVSFSPVQYISRLTQASTLKQISGGTIMVQLPVNNVTLRLDTGNRESWIENWDFKAETFDGVDFENWTRTSGCIVSTLPLYFGTGKDGIFFTTTNDSTEDYIEQDFGNNVVAETSDFVLEFDIMYLSDKGAIENNVETVLQLIQGTYYLDGYASLDDGYNPVCTWAPGATYLRIFKDVDVGVSEWGHVKFSIPNLPTSGQLTIRLFPSDDADIYVSYKDIKFYCYSTESVKRKYYSKEVDTGTPVQTYKTYGPDGSRTGIIIPSIIMQKTRVFGYNRDIAVIEYTATNNVNGDDIVADYDLGDVVDNQISNILSQFRGAIAIVVRYTLAETAGAFVVDHTSDFDAVDVVLSSAGAIISFTGKTTATKVSGEDFTSAAAITNVTGDLDGTVEEEYQAYISSVAGIYRGYVTDETGEGTVDVDGLAGKTITFNTDEETTCANFVSTNAAFYDSNGLTLTYDQDSIGWYIQFEKKQAGAAWDPAPTYTQTTPNFDIAFTEEQAVVVGQKRIDRITLTGFTGTATITCNGGNETAEIVETVTPSIAWLSRSQEYSGTLDSSGNLKALLQLAANEVARQYARSKQLLNITIHETGTAASTLNTLGCIRDDWNVEETTFPIRSIADWTLANCTLALQDTYVQYEPTDTAPTMTHTCNVKGWMSWRINIRYRVSAGTLTTAWEGYNLVAYYATEGHTVSSSYYNGVNLNADGDWHVAVLDMSSLVAGGTDWMESIITSLRVDIHGDTGTVVDIDWIGFPRAFVVNRGTFDMRNREWDLDLCEII